MSPLLRIALACVASIAMLPAVALATIVVEYVNSDDFPTAPGGHYFYSSDAAEQAAIDAGAAGRFRRTGLVFHTGGSTAVCRFYGSVAPGPNSHFFTADAAECAALRAQQQVPAPASVKQWNYEGTGFSVVARTAASTCPDGAIPVYRAYNNGFARGIDSNHRYATSIYALRALSALGWTVEGIVFCTQLPPGQAALVSEVLDCGTVTGHEPPADVAARKIVSAGPGLQRTLVDLVRFPGAVCNDGTAAVFYYRPYNGEANRNKWVFDMRGGGSCSSPAACAQRWCGVDTNFNMNVMTANFTGDTRRGEGILARETDTPLAAANPHRDYNHVEFKYCSSDQWAGTAHDVAFDAPHPVTGVNRRMRMHFAGARVFDAMISMLRRDGTGPLTYTLSVTPATMPDLDDAAEVLFAGPSAGGAGVINNLDRLASVLRANNTQCGGATCPLVVRGLIDSIFGPSEMDLDFSRTSMCIDSGICSGEARLKADRASGSGLLWKPRLDDSCVSLLAPLGTDWKCYDTTYKVQNHVTTPFFMRMGLTDSLISGNQIDAKLGLPGQPPFTLQTWAQKVRADLLGLSNIRSTAFERNAIATVPGVFGPSCQKHDTLEDNAAIYQTSVRVAGTSYTMFDVWNRWIAGQSPSSVVSTTATDATCP